MPAAVTDPGDRGGSGRTARPARRVSGAAAPGAAWSRSACRRTRRAGRPTRAKSPGGCRLLEELDVVRRRSSRRRPRTRRVSGLFAATALTIACVMAAVDRAEAAGAPSIRRRCPRPSAGYHNRVSPPGRSRWTLLRRFLVVQALMLWQGGFLFYTAVVVPTGTAEFGSFEQGRSPGIVTDLDQRARGRGPGPAGVGPVGDCARPAVRWGLWAVMAGSLAGLVVLHPRIESGRRFRRREDRRLRRLLPAAPHLPVGLDGSVGGRAGVRRGSCCGRGGDHSLTRAPPAPPPLSSPALP